jgi:hypothetical protein
MATARTPVLLTIATVVGVLLLVRPGQRATPSASAGAAAPAVAGPVESERTTGAAARPSVEPATSAAPGARAEQVGEPVLRPSAATTETTVGEFIYLFDVSGSTRGTSGGGAFAQGADILAPALQALRGLEELLPSRHRVATIGTTSLRQRPLCDITVERPTLFRSNDSAAVTRAVRACDRALRAVPVEPFTDIRGALHYAALSIRGERPALRGILLVTDLEEDVAPGQTPATPVLDGVCVAVYTLVTVAVGRDPDAATIREREWERRIQGWGAKRVRTRSSLGFDPAELMTFFRSCEGR